jgi:hypothetical protein
MNSFQSLKLKTNTFHWLKNNQTLQGARLEHTEQLSQLAQLQIPIGLHVIKFGTNSNLYPVGILKGFKPYRKYLVNSLKISIDLIFTKVNLVWHSCMQEIGVPIQVSIGLDLK